MNSNNKLKVLFRIICFSVVLLFTSSVAVFAGSTDGTGYMGSNGNLFGSYYTFNNINGDGINVTLTGTGNTKLIYARMGEQGSYSSWVASSTPSVSLNDYGAWGSIGNSNYSWYFYWG